MDSHIHGNPSA